MLFAVAILGIISIENFYGLCKELKNRLGSHSVRACVRVCRGSIIGAEDWNY